MVSAFVSVAALGLRAPVLSRSSLCGTAIASAPVAVRAAVSMTEFSPSVPFLSKPKNLSPSLPGYAGFDPFGLTELFDVKWMQESEIKHGRVCMLAVAGIIAQEFVHLPDPAYSNPVATEAFYQVPSGALWQIFLFCGLLEFVLHKGNISYLNMFDNPDTKPGHLGFNPMGLAINERSQLQEIKNGRLAMLACGGFLHSLLIYKTPIIAQLTNFKTFPGV